MRATYAIISLPWTSLTTFASKSNRLDLSFDGVFPLSLWSSKQETQLRYHVAKKKIPALDANGIHVSKPTQINGIKLERFVFDVFPFSK